MRLHRWVYAAVVLSGWSGWACTGSPSDPTPVAIGLWGGDHIVMTIGPAATHVELDCAHGDFSGALTTDAQGRFTTTGTRVREHGGPIQIDDQADRHPAVYSGSVQSNKMSLTIRLADTGDTIGPFTLQFGTQGRILKCL